jgi:hypothetical protein
MFSVKYNRTTNHIDGLTIRTVSADSTPEKDSERGYVVAYSQNACGSLTRYTFAEGSTHESLSDALEAARKAGGRKLCKTCEKAAEAMIAAETNAPETLPLVIEDEPNGEKPDTMANTDVHAKNDVTTEDGTKVIEQIDANVERVRSLAEAENAEGAKALHDETEALISTLTGKGSIAVKKDKRAALAAASVVEPKREETPAPAANVPATLETVDYHAIPGMDDLIKAGANKVKEGVSLGLKMTDVATEVARVQLEMRQHMRNKAGLPDLLAESKYTKNAAKEIYDTAAKGLEADDVLAKSAHASLKKGAQNRMSDVLVEFLRTLDEQPEFAREFFPAAIEKHADKKPTEAVYAFYEENGTTLPRKGRTELAREAAREKAKELEAAKADKDNGEGEGEGEGNGNGAEIVPVEYVSAYIAKLTKANKGMKAEFFGKLTEDEKKSALDDLNAQLVIMKSLVAELIA